MMQAADLRAEAERLARQLPDLRFRAEASEAAHIGSAGRRRAGRGDTFWQYRRYAQEDDAGRIHWRRSAKGHELYVRETELETARTVLFWADSAAGFRWAGPGETHTKAEEAIILMLSMAILLSKDGDRIGVLGGTRKPGFGLRAADRLATDLFGAKPGPMPPPPRVPATLILASDFYDPVIEWTQRLAPIAARCPEGVLLAVSARIEVEFPFEGRTRLCRPGNAPAQLLSRAESYRDEYLERLSAQREALRQMASRMGWGFVAHVTGAPLIETASQLKSEIERFGSVR